MISYVRIFSETFEDAHKFGLKDRMDREVGALICVQRERYGLFVLVLVQAARDGVLFGKTPEARVVGVFDDPDIKTHIRKEIDRRISNMRKQYQAQFKQKT